MRVTGAGVYAVIAHLLTDWVCANETRRTISMDMRSQLPMAYGVKDHQICGSECTSRQLGKPHIIVHGNRSWPFVAYIARGWRALCISKWCSRECNWSTQGGMPCISRYDKHCWTDLKLRPGDLDDLRQVSRKAFRSQWSWRWMLRRLFSTSSVVNVPLAHRWAHVAHLGNLRVACSLRNRPKGKSDGYVSFHCAMNKITRMFKTDLDSV